MANLKIVSVTKSFGDIEALKDLNLEIHDGEFFVLLGPTGAGKTTTLRIVSGLEKPKSGQILLDDEDVSDWVPATRDVAFVFQFYTLYPNLNVRQNLEFPLKSPVRNTPQDEINKKVAEVAKILHIEHLLQRETSNLSGGEMQRVGIGRAIVRSPKAFLMDEPLSNLDAKLREEMRSELSRLQKQLGQTFFYVTHDQTEAMTMADRIGVLNDGVLLQVGSPDEIYYRPLSTFVARFVGSPRMNLLKVHWKDEKLVSPSEEIVVALTPAQSDMLKKHGKSELIMGMRPEDITIHDQKQENNCLESEIYFKQSMGAEDILNLRFEGQVIQATVPPTQKTTVGQRVCGYFDIEHAHFFDSDTELRIE
jgi:multiple sugar transport system ATP-binding protein